MRYLVTGANGFVGFALTRMLLERGHTVHALVRKQSTLSALAEPRLHLFTGDICHADSIIPAAAGCDGVFHTAAFVKPWASDLTIYQKVNVDGTRHVLNAAVHCGVKRVVCTSSAGIFGMSEGAPIDEHKNHPVSYRNPYERSKAAADALALSYADAFQAVILVAPTRIYGPAAENALQAINKLIYNYLYKGWRYIPGNGTQVANYIYVTDAVEGLISAMHNGRNGEYYILGGENSSMNNFFDLLSAVSGTHRRMIHISPLFLYGIAYIESVKPYFGGKPEFTTDWIHKAIGNWEIDCSKANTELGLQPIDLRTGLQLTVDHLRNVWLK